MGPAKHIFRLRVGGYISTSYEEKSGVPRGHLDICPDS